MLSSFMCLALAIFYEAGNQPEIGKIAVANVVMNRVKSGRYPSDICAVISEKNQFSYFKEKKHSLPKITNKFDRAAWDDSRRIAAQFVFLKMAEKMDVTMGSLHYHADYVSPCWTSKNYIKIGSHKFFPKVVEDGRCKKRSA